MKISTPEIYRNFSGSNTNVFSMAARELARRVAGVSIDPNPNEQTPEGFPRMISRGSFDLLVDPDTKHLVDGVMYSPELGFLDDTRISSYIIVACYDEKIPELPLVPDAAKRIEIAKLQEEASCHRRKAVKMSDYDNPVEEVKHKVKAIFAKGTAQFLAETLIPTKDIINQVIDREKALLAKPKLNS